MANDNLRVAALLTSNGYQDRDGEYVTTRALQLYVEHARASGILRARRMPVLYAHNNPGAGGISTAPPIGWVVHAQMEGTWLIELALEAPSKFARRVWDMMQADPNAWGVSHGFYHREHSARGSGMVYHYIDKYETSVLPKTLAANLYTGVIFP